MTRRTGAAFLAPVLRSVTLVDLLGELVGSFGGSSTFSAGG